MNYHSNILLVMGTGRNVGKTFSACKLIQTLSENHPTVGIKISPHFHELNPNQLYLHQSDDCVIVEEKEITQKDSSRMLQAGAEKAYYMQVKDGKLPEAFNLIRNFINALQPVVIESGGLYDLMEPGLLFFVTGEKPKKEFQIRKGTNVVKMDSSKVNYFNWNTVQFNQGKFTRNV